MADGAVASGRIAPWRRDYWLGQIMQGGTAGATAAVSLLQAERAGPEVIAAWKRDPRAARAARPVPPRSADERLYDAIYPPVAGAADPPSHELHDRTGLVHEQADDYQPADQAEQGHGPVFGWHEHDHAHGSGAPHSHIHEHAGDNVHSPGLGVTSHVHQQAASIRLADPVRAGIAARASANGSGSMSDDQLYALLFGAGP
jgi:hypothetical protein